MLPNLSSLPPAALAAHPPRRASWLLPTGLLLALLLLSRWAHLPTAAAGRRPQPALTITPALAATSIGAQ